jgi:hypothetical protein
MFNHEKTQCGSGPEEVNEHDTAMGLIKLGSYFDSDYTLYEIVEPIPDAYNLFLSGWSALNDAPTSRPRFPGQEPAPGPEVPGDGDDEVNDDEIVSPWRTIRRKPRKEDPAPTPPEDPSLTKIPVVGIHHPSGDSKKISFYYNGSLPSTCWSECASKQMLHWRIPSWDKGTTEPGSSGSPLFNAEKRIVGQLHGGSASCWNKKGYDVYGAIHASFQTPPKIKNRLATYLDPDSTGAKFLDGYGMEQARRETRQRHGPPLPPPPTPEPEPPRGDWDEIEWGPLGFEKPLLRADEEAESPSHGRYRLRHPHHRQDNIDRLSRFMNRIWQGLAQGSNNNEEDANESSTAFVEDQVPCHQSQN